jgi:hypothetical protein
MLKRVSATCAHALRFEVELFEVRFRVLVPYVQRVSSLFELVWKVRSADAGVTLNITREKS